MHLPDGLLTPAVWAPAAIASGVAIVISARRSGRAGAGSTAALASFVFAAQTLQFPIPGGASGHLLGGTLLAILLRPPRAVLAMACVFATQAILLGDGGVTALGANILNGGIAPALLGFVIFKISLAAGLSRPLAAGAAAVSGVLAGATICSLEVGLSGTVTFLPFLGAMLGAHLWIALGEALITVAVLRAIDARPEFSFILQNRGGGLSGAGAPRAARRGWVAAFIILTILGAAVWISSSAPDGLESSARRFGLIAHAAAEVREESILYTFAASCAAAAVVAMLALAAVARGRRES
ncbi:MAG: energy-coupling factor ABC transporter permease [Planctomycetes bacterium]|nr:energy-coupling factor ABC transporter permease [Planctomycetota bacterium]